ncbi:MAG: SH3 domain-containing protein [Verrucomicrobiota bacterium]
MKLPCKVLLAIGIALIAGSVLAAGTMSVQVRNGQLRATPSFLGPLVAPLNYGDQVEVLETQAPWTKVREPGGKTGWVHSSALTPKRIAMTAGGGDVKTGAAGDELALATKGFNSDVEAEFKKENQDADFTWVDRMEKYKVTPQEMTAFLKEGGVYAPEGGTP